MTDIALERRLLVDEGLEMRRREEYGAIQDYRSDRACDFRAKRLFLHIALVDDPSDLQGPEDLVARRLEAIGQSRFGVGWSYNAAAFNTGRLYEGQPLTRRGAHTVNTFRRETCKTHGGSLVAPDTSSGFNNNITDRAIVLPQQLDDPVTDEQIDAIARWGAALRRTGLAEAGARWHGHRCVTAKGCPGDRGFARIPELQELTDRYTREGLDMPLTDQDITKIAEATTKQLLAADVAKSGPTVRAALRQAAKGPQLIRGLDDQFADRVLEITQNLGGSTPSPETIKAAVKQALREGTADDDEQ